MHSLPDIAQLHGARSLHRNQEFDPTARATRDAIIITASDGSRAACFTEPEQLGSHLVSQSGPRQLWDTLTATHRL